MVLDINDADLDIINDLVQVASEDESFRKMVQVALMKTVLPWRLAPNLKSSGRSWYRFNLLGHEVAEVDTAYTDAKFRRWMMDEQLLSNGYKFGRGK